MKTEGIPPHVSLGIEEWKGMAKSMRGRNCNQCFNCHLVLQLKATPPFCLALVYLERGAASNSQQSGGYSVSTKVAQRTCLLC